MPRYRIISSDTHVFEPPDLWTSRVEPKYRKEAIQIVPESGYDWWYVDGRRVMSVQPGSQTGMRFEEPGKLTRTDSYENVRLGGYIPEEHVKDMETDGVDVSIIFPTAGLLVYGVADSDLVQAMCRVYNDWLAEFCISYPDRLKGIAIINLDQVQEGVSELERCAKLGLAGGMITVYPPQGRGYGSSDYQPFWAASEDLDMPISLHVATNRSTNFAADAMTTSTLINADHWVRMSLSDMILAGVFERHPNLQVGAVEHELAWVPYFLERMDYAYTQRPLRDNAHQFKENMLPSDYFHRNVSVSFQEDALGIRLRDIIGVDNLLWGSDYPHQESTFPRSQQILEEILADCTQEEKAKIAGANAARIYHLE